MHDIVNNIAIKQALAPQTIHASALSTGDIDCQAAGAVAVVVLIGDITDTLSGSARIDLKIEHTDDDGTGSPGAYAACADADVLNYSGLSSGQFASINSNALESKRYVIGYVGGKRFIRVTATPASLSTGGPIAMLSMFGNLSQKPAVNA